MEPDDTLSIPEHGRSFVAGTADGTRYAVFVYDLAGRLVYRPRCPAPDEHFGAEARWVAFREESSAAAPWHWSSQEFARDLLRWLEAAPPGLADELRELYPDGEPAVVDALYIPVARADGPHKPAEELRRVLAAAEGPNARPEVVQRAMIKLHELGVVELPQVPHFDPRYHEAVDGSPGAGDEVRQVSPGYGYDGTVLRRAGVEPRQG